MVTQVSLAKSMLSAQRQGMVCEVVETFVDNGTVDTTDRPIRPQRRAYSVLKSYGSNNLDLQGISSSWRKVMPIITFLQ